MERVTKEDIKKIRPTHEIWHRFSNWITKTYGDDLHGKWEYMEVGKKKIKYRSFDDLELNRRLVGYDVMERMERYAKRYCPEIKAIRCDDGVFASSTLFLIPHPRMGISVIFIPQCTGIQNQFFLYESHYENLLEALKEMKDVYKDNRK